MLRMLLLDTLINEEINASDYLKAAYSKRDLPIKRLAVFSELSVLLENPIEKISRYNVFIASFSKPEDEYIELAKTLRLQNESIFILFVVDKSVDIAACVRSSVRPSGIMFIPLEKPRIYQTIKEIYIEYMRLIEREEQPVFTVKSGGDYFAINTGDISFFEAQGKKIAIKTRGQEILFYSNFETVLEQLPNWFARSHKGYVVNTKLIIQANFSEMTLKLKDQSIIPISRTYRDEIRCLLGALDKSPKRSSFGENSAILR